MLLIKRKSDKTQIISYARRHQHLQSPRAHAY